MIPSRRVVVVGTAGRDFHLFNTTLRDDQHYEVLAFTSTELPPGDSSRYPAELSGAGYPGGVPIISEADLEHYITGHHVDEVHFAYAEIACAEVARLAARVLAVGADFRLLSPNRAMLRSHLPVIAVTSAHTGAGKTPAVRYLTGLLQGLGQRVAVVQHPLPDGVGSGVAGEVRVEPLPGTPRARLFSGLDQASVLAAAQPQADVIVWDGAGTDLPFLKADLHLVLVDSLRSGTQLEGFPGEVSLRLADAVVISKCDAASAAQVAQAKADVARINPDALVLTADSPVAVSGAEKVAGRTVVVVETEPALALGALRPGAGLAAALQVGVSAIISPLPQAVGRLAEWYRQHPEAQSVLPLASAAEADVAEVRATLAATPSEAVIDATSLDLAARFGLDRPVARAHYELRPHHPSDWVRLVRKVLAKG